MSRLFNDASSEYLTYAEAVPAAAPLTISCWGYTDTGAINEALAGIGRADTTTHYFELLVHGATAGDPIRFQARGGGATNIAVTSSGISLNTWFHACGVARSATDRSVFLNGGSEGTNGASTTPASLDTMAVGALLRSSALHYFSGRLAELGIWNVDLDDAEVAALAAGFSPLLIRPQSLVLYLPLTRDEDEDLIGGRSFSAVNTPSVAAHPRIYRPAPPQMVIAPAADGAHEGAAAFIGAGTMAPTSALGAVGGVTLAGAGAVGAAAEKFLRGVAALAGAGQLVAAGVRVLRGAATLAGAAMLTAVVRTFRLGTVALSEAAVGSLSMGESAIGAVELSEATVGDVTMSEEVDA